MVREADFDTVRPLPKSQDRSRSRLLASVLCFALHGIILVALLYQAGAGRGNRRPGETASSGDLVEMSIAPPGPAKSLQTAQPHAQTASRPQPETSAASPGDHAKAPPAIVGSGADAGSSGDSGSTLAAGSALDFQQQLFSHIQRFQIYPAQARQDRLQGRVIIVFVMSRAGMVLDARIQTSSGYPLLDQAAVDTVTRAQPLPGIPADIADPLEVEIPIEFSLAR